MIEVICKHYNLPMPEREYRFHPKRRWRVDYGWPDPKYRLAVEVEGGAWKRGRHNRPLGFFRDMEKYNQLTLMGWHLLRMTPQDLTNGTGAKLLLAFFNNLGIP